MGGRSVELLVPFFSFPHPMPCTSLTVLYCTCRTQLITYSITHCQYLYHLYSRQGSTVRSTVQSIHILSPILLLLLFLLLLLLLYYYYLIHIPYPMPQIICQCQFHRSLQLKLNQNPVPVLVLLLTYYHTIPGIRNSRFLSHP